MLWQKLILRLYLNLMNIHALRILIERSKYTKKPEEYYIQSFYINSDDYIYEELFYTEEYRFKGARGLKDAIDSYNRFFQFMANRLNDHELSKKLLDRMVAKINIVLNSALTGYLSAFREINIVINGMEAFATEQFDENIYEELVAYFMKQQIPFLDYMEKNNSINYGTVLKESERYIHRDGYINFFEQFGKGKYKDFVKIYYDYSNKYIEYYLTDCTVVLEDIK